MKIKFKKSHGGREDYFPTKLKKDRAGDCTTRAIAIATRIDYMTIFKHQFSIGLEIGKMPNSDDVTNIILKRFGWVKKSPFTKRNSKKKYRLGNLPIEKNKSYIFRLRTHIVAIVDGTMFDTFDCRPWSAQSYYIKE